MRREISSADLTPKMWGAIQKVFFDWQFDFEAYADGVITVQAVRQFVKEVLKVPNLFPDQSRASYTGSADFIFAGPIDEHDWKRLEPMASFCMNTTKTPFVNLPKETYNDECEVVLLLRRQDESDDDMLEAAAWLRMAKSCTARIYAVPAYRELSMYQRLMMTNGLTTAHRALSIMFDLPKEKKAKNKP